MSYIERRDLGRLDVSESPFELGETFFSRTDNRGVILAANDIFRRVSGYSWEELSQAPHKIIRHPDMPRGFFEYFWKTIQSGKPIAGYVKNLSKDGLYYWVLAIVVPMEGGFLSVRIKPCCGLLDKVEAIYDELLQLEVNDDLSPEDSANLLLAKLKESGFEQYSDFETHALGKEIPAIDATLGNTIDRSVSGFNQIVPAVADLKAETDKLVTLFETVGTIPTNLRILASRIEPAGGPVSSLSENYWKMSNDMTTWFTGFITSSGNAFSGIQAAVNEAMLLRCATRLLSETAEQFASERRNLGGIDASEEYKIISELAFKYEQKATESINKIEQKAKLIANAVSILRRHILGLSTTRVMCKIESAGLRSGGENLSDIITHFEKFQEKVDVILDQLDDAGALILSNARVIKALKWAVGSQGTKGTNS